jgi:SSS family solute:Na+ symporter
MLIKRSKVHKDLFHSGKESWWIIGFSILMASNILIEPQLITSFLMNGDLSGMWLVWASGIGAVFGMVFFGHLWQRLPVKTENELLLFRFSGKGARWLHIFRSLCGGNRIAAYLEYGFYGICQSIAANT